MVNLVHPSLFCYELGKTAVLADVGAEATRGLPLSYFDGQPAAVEMPVDNEDDPASTNYVFSDADVQWLPAEVWVTEEKCGIRSYVNSLHPDDGSAVGPSLYKKLEELIFQAVPVLEEVLADLGPLQKVPGRFGMRCNFRERSLRIPSADTGSTDRAANPYGWWKEPPHPEDHDEDEEDFEEYSHQNSSEYWDYYYESRVLRELLTFPTSRRHLATWNERPSPSVTALFRS
jgi:hypothetical protein